MQRRLDECRHQGRAPAAAGPVCRPAGPAAARAASGGHLPGARLAAARSSRGARREPAPRPRSCRRACYGASSTSMSLIQPDVLFV